MSQLIRMFLPIRLKEFGEQSADCLKLEVLLEGGKYDIIHLNTEVKMVYVVRWRSAVTRLLIQEVGSSIPAGVSQSCIHITHKMNTVSIRYKALVRRLR